MAAPSGQSASKTFVSRLVDAGARYRRSLLVAVVAAVFMSSIGAFDSHHLPPIRRLVYWLTMMLSGTALGIAVMTLARGLPALDGRPWLKAAILTLMLWAPATVMVGVIMLLMLHTPWSPNILVDNAGPVLLVSAAMTAINYLADRKPTQTHAATDADAAPPAFLERLPGRLRGAALYAVEAEDHYLRLHTSDGADLILMRLSDAIAELEGIEGAQTHRSWWVARDGVDDARRFDGKAVLRLKSGAEVPVSRTYVRALRQAGWF